MNRDTSSYQTIVTERIGLVERITLNRPERRNALSFQLQEELLAAVRTVEMEGDARAIVIRGNGPSFCSGYDVGPKKPDELPSYIKLPMSLEQDIAVTMGIGQQWSALWHCRIPIIAQVHGYCIAGGTDLAFHCDLVVAAEDARIGFPPVRSHGGPPSHMWVYLCGPQWAKRLLLTGDTISGIKAAEIGLALEAVPRDQLDDHVMELAQHIAKIPHDLLVSNKRIVNLGVELMGRSTMQMLAGIHDSLGHHAPEALAYAQSLRERGVRESVAERDTLFQ